MMECFCNALSLDEWQVSEYIPGYYTNISDIYPTNIYLFKYENTNINNININNNINK